MIDVSAVRPHYSAEVRLWLEARGEVFPLAQIGPGHVVFRQGVELEPCDGEVVMTIDGRERRWMVTIAEPVTPIDSTDSPVRVRFLR